MNDNKDLICPICGEPTSAIYGNARKDKLCREHAAQLKKGIIEIDEHGNFIDIKTKKVLNKIFLQENRIEQAPSTNEEGTELICLTCDKSTNGKHFCYECWNLYKKKTLYLKIIDCKHVEKLDAEYEGHLETKDGHIVKSHVERDIDNYLFSKNIPHAYESTYDVDGNPAHEFKPDFYLPNYLGEDQDVYIEYFGMKGTKDGDKKIEYKIPIYKRDKATLICLYPHDDSKIEAVLKRKLNKERINIGEINWYEE